MLSISGAAEGAFAPNAPSPLDPPVYWRINSMPETPLQWFQASNLGIRSNLPFFSARVTGVRNRKPAGSHYTPIRRNHRRPSGLCVIGAATAAAATENDTHAARTQIHTRRPLGLTVCPQAPPRFWGRFETEQGGKATMTPDT